LNFGSRPNIKMWNTIQYTLPYYFIEIFTGSLHKKNISRILHTIASLQSAAKPAIYIGSQACNIYRPIYTILWDPCSFSSSQTSLRGRPPLLHLSRVVGGQPRHRVWPLVPGSKRSPCLYRIIKQVGEKE